jgi:serine/threonine-protein kinase
MQHVESMDDADRSAEATVTQGQILAGKYRVENVIGRGGMGVVLAAEHLTLNQKVAIKLLRTAALGHTDVVGRFIREARAVVRLKSEHVARVIDVGNLEDGRPYIVMERLVGEDLGDRIERGPPLAVHEAVDFVMQACEAIAEAHAAGIIHRDLKPKNLFLTTSVHGQPLVKVLDFGISKVDPQAPGEMQLTRTAEVIGSPSYMSPEQLRSSRNVDLRTDIWALGVILYELLTGRLPFLAETVTELVLVVVSERETPVHHLRPDVPHQLAAVIGRCLAKDPAQRFPSVADLVAALEPFARGGLVTATARVRAVAGQSSGRPIVPAASSSGTLPPLGSSSGSRVHVHGGTSVAWGETQSQVGPAPAITVPPRASRRWVAPSIVAGCVALSAAVAGTMYLVKHVAHPVPPPAPVVAAEEGSVQLPPGRKDLPPVATPAPSATPNAPDPPAASALPDTRKAPAKGPAPRPAAQDRPPDLRDIGRR